MTEDNFDRDFHDDQIIGAFLDKYFHPKLQKSFSSVKEIKRNKYDIAAQHRGIDLTIKYSNSPSINIDEKCATQWFDENLETFRLEIASYNKHKYKKDGWLFGEKYSDTDSYLLCWGNSYNKYEDFSFDNIKELEMYSVDKQKLQTVIDETCNINIHNYRKKAKAALYQLENTKQYRIYINSKDGLYWHTSLQLPEKPLNIICPKSILAKATTFKYYVNRNFINVYKRIDNKWVECNV